MDCEQNFIVMTSSLCCRRLKKKLCENIRKSGRKAVADMKMRRTLLLYPSSYYVLDLPAAPAMNVNKLSPNAKKQNIPYVPKCREMNPETK